MEKEHLKQVKESKKKKMETEGKKIACLCIVPFCFMVHKLSLLGEWFLPFFYGGTLNKKLICFAAPTSTFDVAGCFG